MQRSRVGIVEVSSRDGIQNLSRLVSTDEKVRLITSAAAAGLQRIEVTSFVNPKLVPQMADADEVVAGVRGSVSARLSALVMNERGAARGLSAGIDELTFVVLASETFNQRNQGATIKQSLSEWSRIARLCRSAGLPVTFMVAAAFGCPFEGQIALERVIDLVASGLAESPAEVALADTIGCAVPGQVASAFTSIRAVTEVPMRAHLHNTRNTGYANAFAAIAAGVTELDSSLGGLGGCPFAPEATGNIATEDLAWMLEREELATGLSTERMIETSRWIASLGLPTDSLLPRAGAFPNLELAG